MDEPAARFMVNQHWNSEKKTRMETLTANKKTSLLPAASTSSDHSRITIFFPDSVMD